MPEEIGYNMANPEEIKSNTEESEEEYSGEESEEKAEIVEGEENVYGYEDQVCGEEGDSGEDEAVFEKEEEMPSVKAESGEEEKVEVMEPEKIQSAEQNFAAPDHLKLQWEQCIKEQGGEEQSLIANDHDEEIISETEEQDEQQKMKDKKPIVTKVEIIRPAYSHPDDNNPSTSTSIGKSIASRNEGFYDAMMGGKGFEIPNGQPLPDEFQMEVPNSYTALHFSAASSYDTGEDFFLNFSDENGDTNDINYDL
ncbi:hypothetical protein KR009_004986 [Drosophila setifemur]|nr:hypothetical protein KR009_004986 [Drosophila setifemur]